MYRGSLRATSDNQARLEPGIEPGRNVDLKRVRQRSRRGEHASLGHEDVAPLVEPPQRRVGAEDVRRSRRPGSFRVPGGRCRGSRRRSSPRRSGWPRRDPPAPRRRDASSRTSPRNPSVSTTSRRKASRSSCFEYTSHRLSAAGCGRHESKSRKVATPTDPRPMKPTCSPVERSSPLLQRPADGEHHGRRRGGMAGGDPGHVLARQRARPGPGRSRSPTAAAPSVIRSLRRSDAPAARRRRARRGCRRRSW